MITFLLMNCIVAAGSFAVVYKLFRMTGFFDSLACWFIVYLAQVITTEMLLGALGALRLEYLIFLNILITLSAWHFSRGKSSTFNAQEGEGIASRLLKNRTAVFALCVILSFAAVKIFINLANPPFGWDSLNYHFTFPVEWIKHANLDSPIVISDDPSPSYYPAGGALFYLWLIFPFKSVFLADVGQLPFFVLALISIYGISRKLEISEEHSFYAAALFLLIPNFFKQLQIAYVDVMVAALFLASLNMLFLLRREFSLRNVLCFGLGLGLFLSVKTVSLPYAFLLFVPFAFLAFKERSRLPLLLGWALFIIGIGGFFYIKNLVETGNPLYPLDFKLFGATLFKGPMDGSIYRMHFKPEDYRISKLLFHEGLGLQTLIFVLPSVFLALPIAAVKLKKKLTLWPAYFLLLPLAIYLIYRYAIPLANTRYLYPLLGVGMICGFYAVRAMNIPARALNIAVIICVISSMTELAKRQELVVSVILACVSFPLFIFLIKRGTKAGPKRGYALAAVIIALAVMLFAVKDYYAKNEYPGYLKMVKYSGFWPEAARAWDWLNRDTGGDNVAYVGRPVPFPLYGSGFKNNVYYVSVNQVEPAKLHYFPRSSYRWGYDFLSLHRNLKEDGNYRGQADPGVWMANLMRRDTDYLFVYSLHQTKETVFPVEDRWAKANPDKFSPVFSNDSIHIYKVKK